MDSEFYQFTAKNLQGKEISMDLYKNKVVLVVNTASKCGFTPQYEALEQLYIKYQDKGLVILAFPCNQFGSQEPGSSSEIAEFCLVNYGVTFPVFEKIEVNGPNAHPLFIYLKNQLPGFPGKRIKWNFTKFLIDKEGKPVKRFASSRRPEKIDKHIIRLI